MQASASQVQVSDIETGWCHAATRRQAVAASKNLLPRHPQQGRENIASRPLKIIAISVIFCGNLHKKIAPVILHFEIFVLKNFTLAQVFFV
jgi:hypothetical protein